MRGDEESHDILPARPLPISSYYQSNLDLDLDHAGSRIAPQVPEANSSTYRNISPWGIEEVEEASDPLTCALALTIHHLSSVAVSFNSSFISLASWWDPRFRCPYSFLPRKRWKMDSRIITCRYTTFVAISHCQRCSRYPYSNEGQHWQLHMVPHNRVVLKSQCFGEHLNYGFDFE